MAAPAKKQQVQEIIKCGKDPCYFFNSYVKIQHPVRGLINFDTYQFQDDCVDTFTQERFSIILKSRQLGLSTLVAAYSVWLALYQRDKNILVIATKLSVAQNFITKVKTMIRSLPQWLVMPEIISNNKQLIELSNGSSIKAIPTSDDAGRSEALSLLIIDEAAFVKNFDELWMGLYPTISTGGRVIILSTPNGVGGQYHKLYTDAAAGLNEFKEIKLPWNVHPERDAEWFSKTTKNLSDRQIAQEYLCDFSSSGDTFLSNSDLEYIRNSIRPPRERTGIGRGVWVWEYPLSESRYLISADIARGDSKDFSTFHIIDIDNAECVAEYKGKIPPDRFGELLVEFGKKYNNALLVPENNSYGYATIIKLKELAYPNIYYKKRKAVYIGGYTPEVEADLAGFTTSGRSRSLILTKLEEVLRNKMVRSYSSRLYEELKTFVWLGNKAQGMKGHNDDLVMSFAIGMWIFDSSEDHSRNSKKVNDAMLKAMGVSRQTYDELPNAILEGRPHNNPGTENKNIDTKSINRKIHSSDIGKKINILSEFDWVYK
jgi:hypothetical protein|tara:strand:+ start:83222 stop:84850 length:1629 start_codon:yes stop_codon:yes gene_type:complete